MAAMIRSGPNKHEASLAGVRATLRERARAAVAGLIYFVLTFGAGFVLGPIRVLWVVPRVGARTAELLEMPIMFVVIVAAARWVVRRVAVPPGPGARLGMGCLALALMLAAEFTLVLRLRGMTIADYFATLDPVSGTAFFLMQGVMALMPLLVGRCSAPGP
jgi:hypothetical protein